MSYRSTVTALGQQLLNDTPTIKEPFVNMTGQETRLSLTNRATRLEVSQGHQTLYHTKC